MKSNTKKPLKRLRRVKKVKTAARTKPEMRMKEKVVASVDPTMPTKKTMTVSHAGVLLVCHPRNLLNRIPLSFVPFRPRNPRNQMNGINPDVKFWSPNTRTKWKDRPLIPTTPMVVCSAMTVKARLPALGRRTGTEANPRKKTKSTTASTVSKVDWVREKFGTSSNKVTINPNRWYPAVVTSLTGLFSLPSVSSTRPRTVKMNHLILTTFKKQEEDPQRVFGSTFSLLSRTLYGYIIITTKSIIYQKSPAPFTQ
mmetsp:Transcript_3598/g.7176  ORF Transcript_3598/g.7176 Transcript_3598/m.7176 type:complete len:254 (-) Transcript_3598:47-808(-)